MQRHFSFEDEVRRLVERFGYRAVCAPRSGDHGVDVVAEKAGRKVAVQVKLFESTSVGNGPVIALLGGMRIYGATEALLITTGKLTKKAKEACTMGNVEWYDGKKLWALCIETGMTLPSWCHLANPGSRKLIDTSKSITVGRETSCDVSIPDDPLLSRRHFQIQRSGLRLDISDLESTNGTEVNGVRICAPVILRYGDKITTGNQGWRVVTSCAELPPSINWDV